MDDLIRIVTDKHSRFRWAVRQSFELFGLGEPKVRKEGCRGGTAARKGKIGYNTEQNA
jgi:hypothetical protein